MAWHLVMCVSRAFRVPITHNHQNFVELMAREKLRVGSTWTEGVEMTILQVDLVYFFGL